MGNLFCKQTSIPATSDLSKAIDPTGTNFLQSMYMYGSGVHSVRPLDGEEFSPGLLRSRLISLPIEKGVGSCCTKGSSGRSSRSWKSGGDPPFLLS